MREPNMPSKAMIEEWRDNPEFNIAYEAAAAVGKAKREKQTGKAEVVEKGSICKTPPVRAQVSTPLPKPIKKKRRFCFEGPMTGPATQVGTAADQLRIVNVQKLSKAIGDLDSFVMRGITGKYCLAADALREDAPELIPPRPLILLPVISDPMKEDQQKLQQQVLEQLRRGVPSAQIMKNTPGFNGVKLAAWRKDSEFAQAWDKAKAESREGATIKPSRDLKISEPVAQEPVEKTPLSIMPSGKTEQVGFYMVAGQEFRYDTMQEAEEAAEQYSKDTGRRAFVLKAVMEIVPEVVVVSTSRRMIA